MKEWKDREPADFSKVIAPVVKALKFAYDFERKNENKNIPYEGYERESFLATNPPIKEGLTAKNLKWNLEDQGYDALDYLIEIAAQLGIEQGIRIRKKEEDEKIVWADLLAGYGNYKSAYEALRDSLVKF